MGYHTGTVAAVPAASRQLYVEHARACWDVFRRHGAIGQVEGWSEDAPRGESTDFHRAVESADGEAIAFGWITWPDRSAADEAWRGIAGDPAMRSLSMPFDGSRMIHGGFQTAFEAGEPTGPGFYQGFVLPVPVGNRIAYVEAARKGWEMFSRLGALGMVEAWGEDVPHGRRTDFHRATRARTDETVVFSWIRWPDRATSDAAEAAMQEDPGEFADMQMPFDARRMMWAGFELLFEATAPR